MVGIIHCNVVYRCPDLYDEVVLVSGNGLTSLIGFA